jgi:hypothetical protein
VILELNIPSYRLEPTKEKAEAKKMADAAAASEEPSA